MYLAALASFLALDAVMIKAVILPLFTRNIGDMLRDDVQVGVALGFYAFFVAGIIYLAVLPAMAEQSVWRAVKNGAALGFVAYGTYEATNLSTLRGWSWSMLAVDLTWGTVLTATVAAIAFGVGRLVS